MMSGTPVRVVTIACAAGFLWGCTGQVGGTWPEEEGQDGPGPGSKPGSSGGSMPGPGTMTGGGTPSGFTPAAPDVVPHGQRVWRLTRTQYNNTVKDLLGDTTGPAASFIDETGGGTGFLNAEKSLGLPGELMNQISNAAVRLAADTLGDAARTKTYLHPCLETMIEAESCAKDFVVKFGRRAFRRPLTTAEQTAYLGLYTKYKADLGAKASVQLIVEAMLQSPHFLFRSELGEGKPDSRGRVVLTSHEVATQLAYYLTNSMPDAELAAAADDGSILKRAELEKHARRLLGSERAKLAVWEMFQQFLHYNHLGEVVDKTGAVAKDFLAAKPSLAKETEAFLRDLFASDDASLTKLLAADYTFVDSGLAKLYGVADPGAGKMARVTLETKDRAGILTQTGLMAVLSHPEQTSPVLRGVFVAERLLCEELPQPPQDADPTPPAADGAKTTRQRYEALTEAPGTTCVACHKTFNAAGYALEHLDWAGRVRREENGVAVQTSGTVRTIDGMVSIPFTNIGDLARKMADHERVRSCVTRQFFRFASGTHEDKSDGPALDEMLGAFEKSGWNLKELLLAHVLTERFVTRQVN